MSDRRKRNDGCCLTLINSKNFQLSLEMVKANNSRVTTKNKE